MGGHKVDAVARVESDLEQIARIEAQNRAAIGGDVADGGEARRETLG